MTHGIGMQCSRKRVQQLKKRKSRVFGFKECKKT